MGNGRPKHTRPDGNQRGIVDTLMVRGYDVDIICDLPGMFDIVVSGKKIILQVAGPVPCSVRCEVKRQGETLSPNEKRYFAGQRNKGALIKIESADDVDEWFGRADVRAIHRNR